MLISLRTQSILGSAALLTHLASAAWAADVTTTQSGLAAAPTSAVKLPYQLDNTISKQQADLLNSDFEYLATHDAAKADPKLMTIMGITQPTSSQLTAWLKQRVHYIVAESFDADKSSKQIQQNYSYQNPNVFPDVLNPSPLSTSDDQNDGQSMVVMLNIGGGVYLAGKQASTLLAEEIPGVGEVQITSPRVGLIQIGEGMFTIFAEDPQNNIDGRFGAIGRLGTLFHEAHHSDGNGKSLGFLHSTCPLGHAYQGQAACDDNLNGPYLVGALVTQAFTESCTDCTDADKEALRLDYLDSFSRVLTKAPSMATEQEIDEVQGIIAGCDAQDRLGIKETPECTQYRQALTVLTNPASYVAATVWDSTPEGKF